MISPDILSVTHTNFAEPTYRRNKTDMLVAYQKAYEGSWRMEDLEIIDVMQRPNYENIIFYFSDVFTLLIPFQYGSPQHFSLYSLFVVVSMFYKSRKKRQKEKYTKLKVKMRKKQLYF